MKNGLTINKKIAGIFLILVSFLSLFLVWNTIVYATDTAEWTSNDSLPTSSGNYKLMTDVTISSTWEVPVGTTNLDLNGHGIRMAGDYRALNVGDGRTLNITDSNTDNLSHYITLTDMRGTSVSDNGTESTPVNGNGIVKVNGGYITGGNYCGTVVEIAGAGICIKDGGTLNINGGTIIGNKVSTSEWGGHGGAGIGIENGGTANLTGNSKIIYNYNMNDWGAGIQNNNNATLSISGNVVVMYNCGLSAIHQKGTLNISGSPQIYKNTISQSSSIIGSGKGIRAENKINITGKLNNAKVAVALNNYGDESGEIRKGQLTNDSDYINDDTVSQFIGDYEQITIARQDKQIWVYDACNIEFDVNGGKCSEKYQLLPIKVAVKSTFKLPELPEMPELTLVENGYKINIYPPEGKTFDAFEVDGERKEFGDTIEINGDTIVKYLWKDMVYIDRIDVTLDAPIAGTVIEEISKYDEELDNYFKTQNNIPKFTFSSDADYEMFCDSSWIIPAKDGKNNPFTGVIKSNCIYYASAVFSPKDVDNYRFSKNVKVFVNGVETTDIIYDDTGIFTEFYFPIKSVNVVYKVLEGDNQTILQGEKLNFKYDIEYAKFQESGKVYVDGELIDHSNYTSKEGSTVLTFNKDYTNTLAIGEHNVKVTVSDGEAEARFTVAQENKTTTESKKETTLLSNPKTGDNIIIWFRLMVALIIGILVIVRLRKKSK